MLDIGGSELLVIGLVLILVVGPKDLPRVLRSVGQFMAKMRGMTREFKKSIDEMAREADIDDLRKELNSVSDVVSSSVTDAAITEKVEDAVDSTGDLRAAAKEDFSLTGTEKAKPAPLPDAEAPEPAAPEAEATPSSDATAGKLPPLPARPDAETPATKAAVTEAMPSNDVAAVEPAPAVQEEKRAQGVGAVEA